MKFKLYIVAYTIDLYAEELKHYIEILNKYNFKESENHEIDIDTESWIWENYDDIVKYAGTIEINDLNGLISFKNDLPIDFIMSEDNSIILCNDRMD